MSLKAEANKHLTTISILWFALFSSQFIYLFVAHIIKPATTNEESNRIMLFMMGLMALTSLTVGLFFYQRALKAYREVAQLIRRQRDGQRDRQRDKQRDNQRNTEVTEEPNFHPDHRGLGSAFVKYIISLAMIESIAIYGLIAAITTGDAKLSYAFFGVSIIVMLAISPFIKIKPIFNNAAQRLNKSY